MNDAQEKIFDAAVKLAEAQIGTGLSIVQYDGISFGERMVNLAEEMYRKALDINVDPFLRSRVQ